MTTQPLTDVVLYADARKQIDELEASDATVAFAETQEKEARSHCHKLRKVRGNIERAKKDLKSEATAYTKRVDVAAKELDGRVLSMIDRHMKPIETRARAIEVAKKRIDENLASLKALAAMGGPESDVPRLQELAATLIKVTVNVESYGTHFHEAQEVRDVGAARLKKLVAERQKYDADQAELAELRREKAERERRDAEAGAAPQPCAPDVNPTVPPQVTPTPATDDHGFPAFGAEPEPEPAPPPATTPGAIVSPRPTLVQAEIDTLTKFIRESAPAEVFEIFSRFCAVVKSMKEDLVKLRAG